MGSVKKRKVLMLFYLELLIGSECYRQLKSKKVDSSCGNFAYKYRFFNRNELLNYNFVMYTFKVLRQSFILTSTFLLMTSYALPLFRELSLKIFLKNLGFEAIGCEICR